MAWIRRRARKDGLVSVAVQWRDPRGRLQSETFREADAAAAEEFRRLVEACGTSGRRDGSRARASPWTCRA